MNNFTSNITESASTPKPFRVMVVDDSAVIRGFISRWLDEEPDITVVGTAANGLMALRSVRSVDAEVVILDIEMPEMDGMTALPKIIELVPDIKVIMASTLTKRNADISIRALSSGAADYIPKPETSRDVNASKDFRRELLEKVRVLASARRKARREPIPRMDGSAKSTVAKPGVTDTGATRQRLFGGRNKEIKLVKAPITKPEILVIGSSTGGPQALCKFLTDARHFLGNIPVVITQHMPKTFTAILAEHIQRATNLPTKEGDNGELVKPGHIYVAPGGQHMLLSKTTSGATAIKLTDDPPENFCKPAVDPLFRTASEIYGKRVLAVILTGMGSDGTKGGEVLVQKGGTIVVQDEASSVVWGMPGSAAHAGIASAIVPLDDIGATVGRVIMGGKL